ncbi:translation initiation factor IF-3 [Candidatus Albibeggiatoa sp. nov. NOAA]|uniref:translation initiation factor IF-3 n=1 Tax=Candidatus Albibeggiatoa sp. nov. NOAA TaxID=3162724 RepID=UPI003300E39F|nr:translation initiation factor IF-3 [Thiotrichaceae bacterium]
MAAEKNARINEQISVPKVRLIDADGENVGVVSVQDAQARANEAELDLVEISPSAKPPVCRIMDYGKYLFEQNKKRQAAKKKQKQVQVKEVKFRPTTEEGDYQVKLRNAMRFLEDGDKAKVTIRFRGREVTHQDIGRELLARLEKDIGDLGNVEQRPKMEGRQMVMIISPTKK